MEELYTRRRANYTFIFLLVINISLLSAHLTEYVRGLKSFLFYVLNPVPVAATQVIQSGQGLAENLREIVRIHQENRTLRRNIERYEYLDKEYRRAVEENERLRQLMNLKSHGMRTPVVARVVVREPSSWYQWVTIDKGREDGIFLDAPVLIWDGTRLAVLGRVGEVFAKSSKVVLITSALSALPVKIQSTGEDGLLEGQNGPRLVIDYLPQEGNALIGDEIVISPLSSVFPQGIAVGKVLDVTPVKNEAFRAIMVKPAANLNALREVVILISERHSP